VNSNPATIMTDPAMADATYIEPIKWQTVAKIIAKERPDALLPTMGGQTALNCALDLERHGVLEVRRRNDRRQRRHHRQGRRPLALRGSHEIHRPGLPALGYRPQHGRGLRRPRAGRLPLHHPPVLHHGRHRRHRLQPRVRRNLRPWSGPVADQRAADRRILLGWKDEMEVVRDKDNCIIVCSIENFDPMGVHTGDSITVAPAQTLTDKEYQIMRNASLAVLREIGVDTGGSNVQFGICPKTVAWSSSR
jgi:carbamoyl-phosphate synthase large subunit